MDGNLLQSGEESLLQDRFSEFKRLNSEQRDAVLHIGNSLLILAGAGSGKTTVIATKVAYLIHELKAEPRAILALTFTRTADNEMVDRARMMDCRAVDVMFQTFHAFGSWFLNRYCSA